MMMLGLILEDAYADPRKRPRNLIRGPLIGAGLALLSQGLLFGSGSDAALPPWTLVYGGAMALLLSSGIRMMFPPPGGQLSGANAPASWLKLDDAPGNPQRSVRSIKPVAAAAVLLVLLIAYELWRRV
jgi:hypothetical protein